MSDEIEFVNGLFVKPPHQNAPDFVKVQISIKVKDLGLWLREKHKNEDEWVNIDVKEAKSGKWYASVSKYKPKERPKEKEVPTNDDYDDDIPF